MLGCALQRGFYVCLRASSTRRMFSCTYFPFNIQLSGTDISKNTRLMVKGEWFRSSFGERLRDSGACEVEGSKTSRLNKQQPNEMAVHDFTSALGWRDEERERRKGGSCMSRTARPHYCLLFLIFKENNTGIYSNKLLCKIPRGY